MLTKQLSRQEKAWQDYRKYLAGSKFIRPAAHFRVIPIMFISSKNYLETKNESVLELREGLGKRLTIGLILLVAGVAYFLMTYYGKSSGDPESDLIAEYILYSVGGIHVLMGVIYFLGKVSIRMDNSKKLLLYTTLLREFFFHPVEIPFTLISHIQIETLPGGRGPDYDVVKIIRKDKNDIIVYKGLNESLVNSLSRTMSDFIGCNVFYVPKV